MCQHDRIALDISGLTKRFVKSDGLRWPWKRNDNDCKPVVAVDRVSFQVRREEVFGILGPNGSGKSTLVRCIATLLLPDEGCITVFGHDVLREEMAVKQLIPRFTHMVGQTLFSLVYGLLHTSIILGVVALFFHLDLSGANLLGGLLMLVAGSLSFIGLGIVASVLPLLFPERGAQMTHVIQALLLLISGVYFPISVLPEWMQPLARFSPATYVLEDMRAALLDGADTGVLLGHLGRLVLIGVVAIPVGLAIFRQAEKYAKRTGKLKRSG